MPPERILIADDDLDFRNTLEDHLKEWGYEVISVRNGRQAWHILQAKGAPRLAILDWNMPEMDGVEVCRRVRERTGEPYTYLLLLTVNDEEGYVMQGLQAGADDYVTKPFYPRELKARLHAGERILKMQEELIVAREALRVRATQDSVTGLWNRSAIIEILQKEIARAAREGTSVGLIMIDLDHFKRVNDENGHLAGDAVLAEAAARMRRVLREYDSIGRYGGDEFLVVLPQCSLQQAVNLAERIRSRLAESPIHLSTGQALVTSSLGVVASGEAKLVDAPALIRLADAALYRAKNQQRNRVEIASIPLTTAYNEPATKVSGALG